MSELVEVPSAPVVRMVDRKPLPGEVLKPRELIEVVVKGAGKLTLEDKRLFNLLLRHAWGELLEHPGHTFEIPLSKLRDHGDEGGKNDRIEESIARLMSVVVIAPTATGGQVFMHLLGRTELEPHVRGGVIAYRFDKKLAALMRDSTVFAKLDIEVMQGFSSKYALALYELVSRRIRMKHVTQEEFQVDDLRALLGVEEGRYGLYQNLRMRVLEPALREVSTMTPYDVSLTPKRRGRKVVSLVLGWNVKTEDDKKAAYTALKRTLSDRSAMKSRAGRSPINPEKAAQRAAQKVG